MVLWSGDNVGERKRQSIYDVLARGSVERVRGPEHVRFGRLVGILATLAAALIFGGGLLWWGDKLARFIAAR
jgi:hypothetical protein